MKFDYYYGIEAEQFSFYRVPRVLIKDARFKGLSSDAKLLYGLMLDRMSLSMQNGWVDDENRAYIIYTVDSIVEDLGCSKPTCTKIIRELDSNNGIGLIEKKRRGLGKPDIIYVKNFTSAIKDDVENEPANADKCTEVKNFNFWEKKDLTSESEETLLPEEKNTHSGSEESLFPEAKEFYSQKQKNLTSGSKETLPQEVKKYAPNYTDYNHTDRNNINPINQSDQFGNIPDREADNLEGADTVQKTDMMDEGDGINAYMKLIRQNIEYDYHMKYDSAGERAMFEEIYALICDVVCVPRKTIRIGKEQYPYELVKARFLKLNSSHVEYVRWCLRETNTKINNIKAYLLTALYNAPSTINHFYQQEVQHNMYG